MRKLLFILFACLPMMMQAQRIRKAMFLPLLRTGAKDNGY